MFLGVQKTTGKVFLATADQVARELGAGAQCNYYKLTVTPVHEDVIVGQDDNGEDITNNVLTDHTLSVSNKVSLKGELPAKQKVELEADGAKVDEAEV
jgi:hypothetical protein